MTAKLEGFIAMKTNPITNSVNKWAERATCKVKQIIGWIQTGEKDNKEAIERLGTQNRDHFRHKAYKNPWKKKKRKGQYSTFYT